MPESPSASALRVVERDLAWSLDAMRRLIEIVDEAARHLAEDEPELAERLRSDARATAYARMRGQRPLLEPSRSQ